jgi:hypothetical protein
MPRRFSPVVGEVVMKSVSRVMCAGVGAVLALAGGAAGQTGTTTNIGFAFSAGAGEALWRNENFQSGQTAAVSAGYGLADIGATSFLITSGSPMQPPFRITRVGFLWTSGFYPQFGIPFDATLQDGIVVGTGRLQTVGSTVTRTPSIFFESDPLQVPGAPTDVTADAVWVTVSFPETDQPVIPTGVDSFTVGLKFQSDANIGGAPDGNPLAPSLVYATGSAATSPGVLNPVFDAGSNPPRWIAYPAAQRSLIMRVITAPAPVTVTPCNIVDITGIGGPPALPDGLLTGDDFNAFVGGFAAGDPLVDITGIGGPPAVPDGLITGDDFVAFISLFAAGCP